MLVTHTIAPVYSPHSRVLILGTMPSPKSREAGFYYSHPQNRFWRVLSSLFCESVPKTIEEKESLILRHKLALWDVLKSCQIEGASDSSIKDPVANDISLILKAAPIRAIFCTGAKSALLYHKLLEPKTGLIAVRLPSSSPANCAVSLEKLKEAYSQILKYL